MPQSAHQRNGRQRFTDRNRVQQNTAWLDFARAIAVTFCPAFAVGRSLPAAQPEAEPDQGLNEIEQSGIKLSSQCFFSVQRSRQA